MNYRSLKEFLNNLSDEQLDQDVVVWGEDFSKSIKSISILEEDYIDPSGDGAEPVSRYHEANAKHFDTTAEIIVAEKGEIWLFVE